MKRAFQCISVAWLVAGWASTAAAAEPAPVTFVACAPGYPGTTAEAQPAMDALAGAIADAAGWARARVAAAYHQAEKAGLARIEAPDVGVVMVPLAFYLEHGDKLKLQPRLAAVMADAEATETWTLVAKRGAVTGPAALDGWQLVSLAGFSPRFIRNVALAGWGRLPDGVKITHGSQVLSALRKAAKGDPVALLLDGAQAAAVKNLPFAADLELVAHSAPLPANLVCTVGDRVPEPAWLALSVALQGLSQSAAGAEAMKGVRLTRFVPADQAAIAAAKRLFAGP